MAPAKRRPKPDTNPSQSNRRKGGQPGNQNAGAHLFYSDQFTDAELALVASFVQEPGIDDELWMQRVVNRRLFAHLNAPNPDGESIDVETLTKLAEALAVGTGRVARLLRDRRALSGEAADGLTGAIAQALDELSTELGIEL